MEVAEQDGPTKGWTWVEATPAPTAPPTSDARPSVTARARVPAAGRGSQINPDQSMRGLELATTPLAHPTGIDAIDGFTSPLGIASLAAGGAGIARAGVTEGAMAGVKAAVGQATPVLKYELTKTTLEKVGIPSPLAMAAAMMVSGYRGNGKHAPTDVVPEGVETAQDALARKAATATPSAAPASPVASAPVAPAPPAASAPPPIAPSPSAASAPSPATPSPVPQAPPPDVMRRLSPATEAAVSVPPQPTMGPDGLLSGRPGGNPSMPDQRALNEAALAVRRAAYQARMSSAPPPVEPPAAPAAGNVKLSAAETKAFLDLMKRGVSGPDAMKNVLMQRELAARLGSPTDAAMKADMTSRYRAGQKTLGGYDKP